MKTFFMVLGLLCLLSGTYAQYDSKFYYPRKEWIACELPAHEDIYFYPEQDTIHSILCKPEGETIATIFYIHGNSGNISNNASLIAPLVKAGFQVFTADFRGFGKSSGKPTHLNIAADGQMILDSLFRRPDIKGSKFIVYGASIGSQLATKLAKDNQEKIDGLVLEGGMSSFTDVALLYIPTEQREFVRPHIPSPYASQEDIAGITGMPKLVIHSKEDKSIPYEQAEAVLKNAQEPKKFLTCKGGHIQGLINDPESIIAHIKELIK